MENQNLTNPTPDQEMIALESTAGTENESAAEIIASETTTEASAEAQPEQQISDDEKSKIISLIQSNLLPEAESPGIAEAEESDVPEVTAVAESAEAEVETPEVSETVVLETEAVETEVAEIAEVAVVAEMEILSSVDKDDIRHLIASDQVVDEETQEEDEAVSEHDFAAYNKLQLVELLEETVQEHNISIIKNKVSAIKVFFLKLNKEDIDHEMEQFISAGGEKESFEHNDDPLELRFKAAFNLYKDSKARHNEQLEHRKSDNLVAKQAILEELKNLILSEETLKKTYDEFKNLQERWKDIGQVPAGEITNLWNNYHFLVEKFFDKVKINRELRDLDMKKNLEAKIELCEKAEELLLEESVVKAFKLLQKFHDEWKEIGPVPQDKKDEVWERFKTATDKINAIRRDHYSKIQDEQQGNFEAKVALCEKAEELVSEQFDSINQWMKKSDEVSELFKIWRSVGQAPKKQNDEIWARFKTAMDAFFENKKEYFNKLKEQQLENYNQKLDLCVQAEALKESTEWRKSTDQLRNLQEEWKKIGPVPRKNSDKIWKRFRSACDEFFSRKSEHFSGIRGREDENMQKKKELIEKITGFEVTSDRSANLDSLKALQRQWMEIGHVPIKVKDQLYADYRAAIDKLFEKMKLTEHEVASTHYRNVVDNYRDDNDGGDRIRRERINMNNKIAKLREEILLLENNIGFFANSKQADIMKAEYEKKISKAKSELTLLEAKLKMLRD
jgi:hypothetical protein